MPRLGSGYQLGDAGNKATFINLGDFIGAIIYFLVFMITVYIAIVLPYRHIQKRRGVEVFGECARDQGMFGVLLRHSRGRAQVQVLRQHAGGRLSLASVQGEGHGRYQGRAGHRVG